MVFAFLALLPPAWQILSLWRVLPDQGPSLPLEEAYPLDGNPVWSGQALQRPNIYWIVVDSYPNLAELKKHYSYDNLPFILALEERGFYVARQAHAKLQQYAPLGAHDAEHGVPVLGRAKPTRLG